MYHDALNLINSLLKELKRLDDKMVLVEVQLLESRVCHALRNLPKSRVVFKLYITSYLLQLSFKLMILNHLYSRLLLHQLEHLRMLFIVRLFFKPHRICNLEFCMLRIRTTKQRM